MTSSGDKSLTRVASPDASYVSPNACRMDDADDRGPISGGRIGLRAQKRWTTLLPQPGSEGRRPATEGHSCLPKSKQPLTERSIWLGEQHLNKRLDLGLTV